MAREEVVMVAAVSVRDLDDNVNEPEPSEGLLSTLMSRLANLGVVELDLPHRATPARAAICCAHKATLPTRNIKDFKYTGIVVIDPWR